MKFHVLYFFITNLSFKIVIKLDFIIKVKLFIFFEIIYNLFNLYLFEMYIFLELVIKFIFYYYI